jgi:hypothetical protein
MGEKLENVSGEEIDEEEIDYEVAVIKMRASESFI